MNYQSQEAIDWLMARVKKNLLDGCWLWQGYVNERGYGNTTFNYQSEAAHRLSWRIFKGDIPEGLWVLHKCDRKTCVNPDHLRLGTHEENCQDALDRGRYVNSGKTHCTKGHPLSGDNLYIPPNGAYRMCRTCQKERNARRHQEIKSGAPKKWTYQG